jgi:hypothetical protein
VKSPAIQELLARVSAAVAPASVSPYGTGDEETHGHGFTISGVPAIFSVHTQDGNLPAGTFDLQIESSPPGDYVYNAVVEADDVLLHIARVAIGDWPTAHP